MRRVVLDVNVLISAVIFPGVCRTILSSLEKPSFTPVISPRLFEDFIRALEKPKIKRLLARQMTEAAILLIHEKALVVEPKIKLKVCRDPADDAVLEAALDSKSEVVVTGDKDLLVLHPFKGISVLPPSTFLRKYL